MTDPASAVQRKVQQLVDTQIATLSRPSLTEVDLLEYQARGERIQGLYSTLDQIGNESIPKWHPRLRARNRKSLSGRD